MYYKYNVIKKKCTYTYALLKAREISIMHVFKIKRVFMLRSVDINYPLALSAVHAAQKKKKRFIVKKMLSSKCRIRNFFF